MIEEKFKPILDEEEKIKWCNDINYDANTKKVFLKYLLWGLFPPFAMLMLGVPYSIVILILSLLKIIPVWIGPAHFIFSVIACLVFIKLLDKNGKNTFFCITNKRIIKRTGAFNNKFVSYSLKNIGTIEVSGGLFDRKDNNPSANLIIRVKDFHHNSEGTAIQQTLNVNSLNDAYEAYKLLNNMTEGNNEVLRIKNEK